MSEYVIGGFWAARELESASYARQFLCALPAIRRIHPAFEQLYRARDHAGDPIIPIPEDIAALAVEIQQGFIRDDSGTPMPGAGSSVAWNDNTRRFEQAAVLLHSGATSGGSVQVLVPPEVAASGTPPERIHDALAAIVECFKPDWASVVSPDQPVLRDRLGVRLPTVGWHLYLSDRYRGRVDSGNGIKAGGGESWLGGVLYTTTRNWFDPSIPSHASLAQDIQDALVSRGEIPA